MPTSETDARRPATRVLVVDDETTVAEVLRRLLVKEGYAVDVFNDGRRPSMRCRRCARTRLFDVNMPGLSGIEVCRR